MTKRCTKCNIVKDKLLFSINNKTKDKLFSWCKQCVKECDSKRYVKRPRKIIDKQICNKCKKSKEEGVDFYRSNQKNNGVKSICKQCEYEYKKAYRNNNREHIRQLNRNRKKTNRHLNLRNIFSARVRNTLKKLAKSKNGESITKHLPYKFSELKQHLESQFEPWMSWDNWGVFNKSLWNDNDQSTWTWQIDHIIPHSLLPYDSMEHENFKKCWALENLRPLSAKQNFYDGVRRSRHV